MYCNFTVFMFVVLSLHLLPGSRRPSSTDHHLLVSLPSVPVWTTSGTQVIVMFQGKISKTKGSVFETRVTLKLQMICEKYMLFWVFICHIYDSKKSFGVGNIIESEKTGDSLFKTGHSRYNGEDSCVPDVLTTTGLYFSWPLLTSISPSYYRLKSR